MSDYLTELVETKKKINETIAKEHYKDAKDPWWKKRMIDNPFLYTDYVDQIIDTMDDLGIMWNAGVNPHDSTYWCRVEEIDPPYVLAEARESMLKGLAFTMAKATFNLIKKKKETK